VEAVTDGGELQVDTIAEKEEMLRGASFHLNDTNQYDELPPAGQGNKHITEQSVERAPFSQSVIKAPCPGRMSF